MRLAVKGRDDGELVMRDILRYQSLDEYIKMIVSSVKAHRTSGHYIPENFALKIQGGVFRILSGGRLCCNELTQAFNALGCFEERDKNFFDGDVDVKCGGFAGRHLYIELK